MAAFLVVMLLIGVGVGYLLRGKVRSGKTQLEEELRLHQRSCLHRYGDDVEHEDFHIISVDGGKRWFKYNEETGDIGREAEEEYPGLLGRLTGMEALTAYIKEQGPLTFTGSNAQYELELVKAAGLSLASKPSA